MLRSLRWARLACERRNQGHNFKAPTTTTHFALRIIEILGLHARARAHRLALRQTPEEEVEIETEVSRERSYFFKSFQELFSLWSVEEYTAIVGRYTYIEYSGRVNHFLRNFCTSVYISESQAESPTSNFVDTAYNYANRAHLERTQVSLFVHA